MRATWLLIAFTAVPGFGQSLDLQVDPAKSRVQFTLGATFHTVHGTFRLKTGNLRVDLATGAASGPLIVDATSGESGSDGRDSRMHKNILESDKYPEITFVPDRLIGKVNGQGPSDVQLHGSFNIHGAAHELTVAVHAEITNGQVDATARFAVPYVKWGMKNPSTFVLRVNDTVQIEMHATGRVTPIT
jgi:polyisoprenoid-binding protein YceI